MSADQFLRFLVDQQGDVECAPSEAEQILQQVLQRRRSSDSPSDHLVQGFTLDDFFHYLFMDDFNGPIKTQVSLLSPSSVTPFLLSLSLCFYLYVAIICSG